MPPRNKYHLFPEQTITYIEEGKEYKINGAIKRPEMKYDKEKETWLRLEPKLDEQGNYQWQAPDLIAIVKAKKMFQCNICKKWGSPITAHWYPHRILKPVWYVGLLDMEGCIIEPWGYTTKICLDCASEIFKDAVVYPCDGWDDFIGNSKTAPVIDKPKIKLIEEIKKR